MQPLDYYHPKDYQEAFKLLTLPDKAVYPLAGATDLIPAHRESLWKIDVVVDIKNLEGMHDLHETPDGLYIGAAVRMNEIAESTLVRSHWDVLAQAAFSIGSEQIRNRATIGGNMCTASPAADTPPALLVLDATAIIRSPQGERRLPVQDFFVHVRKTVLRKGELLVGVIIPKPPSGSAGSFAKLSRRRGSDLSIVSVAVGAFPQNGGYTWRIAMGSVAPTPIRVPEAEAVLSTGYDDETILKAARAASAAAKPISDIRSSEAYRRQMITKMTMRAVREVAASLGNKEK